MTKIPYFLFLYDAVLDDGKPVAAIKSSVLPVKDDIIWYRKADMTWTRFTIARRELLLEEGIHSMMTVNLHGYPQDVE
jgi:hypothetical protein